MAKSAGAGNQVVGKVFILHGTAKAVAPDGTERVLAPNSPIYANELIITGSDGSVSIQFDGPPVTQLDLGRMTEIVIDEDVYSGVAPEAVTEASAEADKIQEALLKGDGEIDLEATAAGGGATGAGGGHPVVNFDLDGNEVTPGSGADTAGITFSTIGTLNGAIAEDTSPIGGIDVAAVDEDGLSEGNLGGLGDHPAVDSFITGDMTYSFGDDGPAAVNPFVWSMDGLAEKGVESQGHELLYEVVDGGLTLNAYYLDEGKYEVSDFIGEDNGPSPEIRVEVFSVTVTDVATGAYTFELYQPLDHAEAGTEDDIVYDFTYTLTDGDGSTGTGSLAMTIDDDTPIIGGSGEDVYTDATNGSGINTVLEVSAGDVITFNWSFDADDYTPFNDFGFVVINGEATKLADISQVGDYNATGWATFTYVATADGPLTIGFGVMNTDDTEEDSHLLIDNLAVNGEVVQSFESGDLTDWDSTGDVTVVTSHDEGGGTPTDGAYMVRLTSTGTYEGALESFFGLPEGAMDAVSNTGLAGSGYDTVTVEDEQMPGGNDELLDGGVASVSGTIVNNVNWGADGFGSATTVSVGEQTFAAGTTVYWAQDGTFLGENIDGPDAAASLVVNSDGTYTYDLLDNMLLGQDEQGEQIDVLSTVSITGVDGDGDPISVPLILNVQDDVPALLMTGGEDSPFSSDTVTVEDEKMQGWLGRMFTDEHDGGVASTTGTIVDNVNWGADGFDSATTFSVGEDDFTIDSEEGTTVYWAQDGEFLGTDGGEDSAASLLVNSDGTYTYNLLDNMLLGQDEQGEQIDVLATVSITGQDGDGDTQAVNVNLQVQDDVPLCITLPDIIAVEDEKMPGGIDEPSGWFDVGNAVVTGTIVNNAAWGADGFGEATTFSVGGEDFDAGDTVYWDQYGNFMGEDSEQPAASMIVNSNGTYTYTLIDNMLLGQGTQGEQINLLDTVTITAQDADGDNVDVDVYLKVQDDKPSCAVSSDTVTVEDEHAPGGINEWWDGGHGHVTGTIVDNVNWGADGFGSATGFKVGSATFNAAQTVYWGQNGAFLGTSNAGAAASLLVNSDGTYTYNLLDNLLLGQNEQGEQIDLLATVSITGQDADGDLQAVSVNLQVQDDTPLCFTLPDIIAVEDEKMPGGIDEPSGWFDVGNAVVTGTIVNNALWGADGFGKATTVSVDGQDHGSRRWKHHSVLGSGRGFPGHVGHGCCGFSAGEQHRHLYLHADR